MYFEIPIILNNINRLTTTRKLIGDLKKLGYVNLHIIDNASTYKPLLEWYDTNPCKVVRLRHNMDQLALYNSGYINDFQKNYAWIVYSDSDIQLNPLTPKDFIKRMIDACNKWKYDKCGLALNISDLPNTDLGITAKSWEAKYWHEELEPNVYRADVDTTFCVIKPHAPFMYTALRVAGSNMTANHIPWYTDFSNLSEEEKYYLEHSSNTSTYKRLYDAYLQQQNHEQGSDNTVSATIG